MLYPRISIASIPECPFNCTTFAWWSSAYFVTLYDFPVCSSKDVTPYLVNLITAILLSIDQTISSSIYIHLLHRHNFNLGLSFLASAT